MSSDIKGATARQQAEAELQEENRKSNVALFKSKLRDLKKAEKLVSNIKNDLAELEIELV